MPITGPTELGVLNDGGSSVFTVPAGGVPSGALLIIRGVDGANTGTYSSSDNHSGSTNVYTATTPTPIPGATAQVYTIWCPITTALVSGDHITLNHNAGTYNALARFTYWTGTATTVDASNTSTGQNVSSWSSGSVTTTGSGDLVVVVGAWNTATVTDTPASGFTDENRDPWAGGGFAALLTQYQIAGAAGSYAGGGTLSATTDYAAQTLAFKAAGAGGNPAVAPQIISGHSTYF